MSFDGFDTFDAIDTFDAVECIESIDSIESIDIIENIESYRIHQKKGSMDNARVTPLQWFVMFLLGQKRTFYQGPVIKVNADVLTLLWYIGRLAHLKKEA